MARPLTLSDRSWSALDVSPDRDRPHIRAHQAADERPDTGDARHRRGRRDDERHLQRGLAGDAQLLEHRRGQRQPVGGEGVVDVGLRQRAVGDEAQLHVARGGAGEEGVGLQDEGVGLEVLEGPACEVDDALGGDADGGAGGGEGGVEAAVGELGGDVEGEARGAASGDQAADEQLRRGGALQGENSLRARQREVRQ